MENIEDNVKKVKDNLPNAEGAIADTKQKLPDIVPTPPPQKDQSSAHDLKSRLEGGEQALTIIDVSERNVFNNAHIMGAISIPLDDLEDRVQQFRLESNRDIYVYGATDEETAQAAAKLRASGFQKVAELKGGLASWRAIAGSTEGIEDATKPPGPEGYNVISQIKHHFETQQSDK
ncbi:MAG TPA: rhodanese-like domain-containing protein [Candidatus Caenarcaniphilales bacterium]|jgi:rhodanese-related sulfurtransferase